MLCGVPTGGRMPPGPAGWKPALPHLPHHPRHLQRRLRRFGAAVVFRAEAADARVLFFLEQEHAMNNRDLVLDLNLREGMRHTPTDVLRMTGFALENNTETNDGRKRT